MKVDEVIEDYSLKERGHEAEELFAVAVGLERHLLILVHDSSVLGVSLEECLRYGIVFDNLVLEWDIESPPSLLFLLISPTVLLPLGDDRLLAEGGTLE